MPLALGAMAVPATVITQMQTVAVWIIATVNMATQGSRAALAQGVQGAQLPAIGTITGQVFPVAFQYLGYFVSSAGQGYRL